MSDIAGCKTCGLRIETSGWVLWAWKHIDPPADGGRWYRHPAEPAASPTAEPGVGLRMAPQQEDR